MIDNKVTLNGGDQEYNAGGDPDGAIRVESSGAEGPLFSLSRSFLILRPHGH